jgi:twitching motility two-component system response regulator PilH
MNMPAVAVQKPHLPEPMMPLRILIVDDSVADVEATAALLRDEGHTVLLTYGSNKCPQIALNEHPDIILMELVIPDVSGFQGTRETGRREATAHIPVIVVSRKDEEMDWVWAMKQEASA